MSDVNADYEYVANFVEDTVSALMADPDAASIAHTVLNNTVFVSIRASRKECGRVIGYRGQVRKAIETVSHAVARKNGCYVQLDIQATEQDTAADQSSSL